MNTADVMNRGMQCLVEHIGLIETEQFISVIKQEKFDYTKWQREFFDAIPPERLDREAAAYASEHPYEGNAKVLIS